MKLWMRTMLALVLSVCCLGAVAQQGTEVGGVTMPKKKTIAENLAGSPVHTQLLAGLQSTGLLDTLSGKGPFTLFAPTDDAFNKLPAATRRDLMKPENKAQLTKVLSYHIVPGKLTSSKLRKMVKKGHGTAQLKTLEGDTLTVKRQDLIVTLTGARGDMAVITTPDVAQKNGVLHVVDAVLMPN